MEKAFVQEILKSFILLLIQPLFVKTFVVVLFAHDGVKVSPHMKDPARTIFSQSLHCWGFYGGCSASTLLITKDQPADCFCCGRYCRNWNNHIYGHTSLQ